VDLIGRRNLTVQNLEGFQPTFRKRGSEFLDMTLTSESVRVADWHNLTSSDQAVISFNIIEQGSRRTNVQEPILRYN